MGLKPMHTVGWTSSTVRKSIRVSPSEIYVLDFARESLDALQYGTNLSGIYRKALIFYRRTFDTTNGGCYG